MNNQPAGCETGINLLEMDKNPLFAGEKVVINPLKQMESTCCVF
jgi:hypothetical protein